MDFRRFIGRERWKCTVADLEIYRKKSVCPDKSYSVSITLMRLAFSKSSLPVLSYAESDRLQAPSSLPMSLCFLMPRLKKSTWAITSLSKPDSRMAVRMASGLLPFHKEEETGIFSCGDCPAIISEVSAAFMTVSTSRRVMPFTSLPNGKFL